MIVSARGAERFVRARALLGSVGDRASDPTRRLRARTDGRPGGARFAVFRRFGGRVGLVVPAAIIWQVDLSGCPVVLVVSYPMPT